MRGILAIYRRELGGYFVSPIAYVVISLFLVLGGIFFYLTFGSAMDFAQSPQAAMGGPIDLGTEILRSFIGTSATLLLFLAPILTMGSYAEERRRGTMEMLMTSPLTEWQIVIGKFFAAFTLFTAMLAPTLIYQFIIWYYSNPRMPWSITLTGYLGLLLMGTVLMAFGSFISSLTENQIIAAGVSFVAALILWLFEPLTGLLINTFVTGGSKETLTEVGQYLSILRHHDDFAKGVIDTSNIVYYLTLTALALFLTHRSLDSMRWRRA